jgi:hypothetical protein
MFGEEKRCGERKANRRRGAIHEASVALVEVIRYFLRIADGSLDDNHADLEKPCTGRNIPGRQGSSKGRFLEKPKLFDFA